MITQSVSWWCFVPELLTPENFLESVRKAGFTAVELVPPEYWKLVLASGLTISAANGHRSLTVGLNRRDQHDRIEKELHETLQLAQQAGIPNLICLTGNRDRLDDDVGAAITAEGLKRVASMAEETGITLVLELLNSKIDHPDYQADHTAFGVEVCRQVSSARVKLLYDIYHMQIMEGDLVRTIEQNHEFIGHYHTAGNPGRRDLDHDQEINYAAVVAAIRKTGYSGYLAHEFLPKADPAAALTTVFRDCSSWLSVRADNEVHRPDASITE
jgi:hydroxypyruvate isomerase